MRKLLHTCKRRFANHFLRFHVHYFVTTSILLLVVGIHFGNEVLKEIGSVFLSPVLDHFLFAVKTAAESAKDL